MSPSLLRSWIIVMICVVRNAVIFGQAIVRQSTPEQRLLADPPHKSLPCMRRSMGITTTVRRQHLCPTTVLVR
jgi:hypothetical protein